jgi:hypothetical protein
MHRGWKIAASSACAAFALGCLMSGTPWLEAELPGGLPLGNALAALGLCALACTALAIASRGWTRHVACVALIAAAAWLPVSIAMAGNLALVFSGTRGDAWIAWSAGVAACALLALALALLHRAIAAGHRVLTRGSVDVR